MNTIKIQPTFAEIMHFNNTLLPQIRIAYQDGHLSFDEMVAFLNEKLSQKIPVEKCHVQFKMIPEKLKEIITPYKNYFVYEVKGTTCHLFLDNDFGHWIDFSNLKVASSR